MHEENVLILPAFISESLQCKSCSCIGYRKTLMVQESKDRFNSHKHSDMTQK